MDHKSDCEIVTLGECDSELELQMVRGLLQSEGIDSFCPNEQLYSYYKILDRQGLILQIRREDESKARAILDARVGLPVEGRGQG